MELLVVKEIVALKVAVSEVEDSSVPLHDSVYASLVKQCTSETAVGEGNRIHSLIVRHRKIGNVYLGNLLVRMYGKFGNVEEAQTVFQALPVRNVFSWTIMVAAFTENGYHRQALGLLKQMQLERVKPNEFTFTTLLTACSSSRALAEGREIHSLIVRNGCEDGFVGNALVSMYGKCGSVEEAEYVFRKMRMKDLVSWNAMLATYAQNGCGNAALKTFQDMELEGIKADKVTLVSVVDACTIVAAVSKGREMYGRILSMGLQKNMIVATALVNLYGKCGIVEEAKGIFERMGKRDVVSWNAMIAAYAQHGQPQKALDLFEKMTMEGIHPTQVTFVAVLCACKHAGLVCPAVNYFIMMVVDNEIAAIEEHYCCMVDLLGQSGHLNQAHQLILSIKCLDDDKVTWLSLMSACEMHGHVRRGAMALHKLIQIHPTDAAPYVLMSNIHT